MVSLLGSIVLYIIFVVINWRQNSCIYYRVREFILNSLDRAPSDLVAGNFDEALYVRTSVKNHALSTSRSIWTRSNLVCIKAIFECWRIIIT